MAAPLVAVPPIDKTTVRVNLPQCARRPSAWPLGAQPSRAPQRVGWPHRPAAATGRSPRATGARSPRARGGHVASSPHQPNDDPVLRLDMFALPAGERRLVALRVLTHLHADRKSVV